MRIVVELLSEVNNNGEYTGRVLTREETHEQELPHPVVHVWIVNEKGEVLLQKRSPEKSMYAGVLHISAAGHIESGEEPLPSAVREVREEVGLKTKEEEYISLGSRKVHQVIPETGKMDREYVHNFLLFVNSKDLKLTLQKEEVAETTWVSLDEMERQINDEEAYKKYLNHPKNYYTDTISKIRKKLEK